MPTGLQKTVQFVATLLLLSWALAAGEVRVSFLRETNVLRDTAKMLKQLKCEPGSIAAFEKAVKRYYTNEFQFDLGKFPKSSNGWYTFQSPSQLVAALPHRLEDTEHPYELNCYDTVILLSAGHIRFGLQADDLRGTILAPQTFTNGIVLRPVATARDAFAIIYPAWYLEATAELWPPALQENRLTLATVFYRYRMLPLAGQGNPSDAVLKTLQASWKVDEIRFPSTFEIVLCHELKFPSLVTTHAGLLIPRNGGYTYIEKNGGSGPFVQLELGNREDLIAWLSGHLFKDGKRGDGTHFFATFNDARIQLLKIVE